MFFAYYVCTFLYAFFNFLFNIFFMIGMSLLSFDFSCFFGLFDRTFNDMISEKFFRAVTTQIVTSTVFV